jgi:chloramphenicol 3-O-phosphotransferase
MSDVVFLYGPPAAGKFTIGSKIAELTGYSLFHNHLTVDAVKPVFPENDEWRHRALIGLRAYMLELAAEAGRSIIFTLAYSGAVDDGYTADIVTAIEKHGGRVCFVQVYTPPDELKRRCVAEHRVRMGKMHTPDAIQRNLDTRDHYARVKYEPHLRIDTTRSTADDAARQVVAYYNLPMQAEDHA